MTAVGPLCKRGHPRAVHERRYARSSRPSYLRWCSPCQRERRAERRAAIRTPAIWPAWITQSEIVERIEALRAEDGFDSREQDWQTFASPLPAHPLCLVRLSPRTRCAWCDGRLSAVQIKQRNQACSRSCGNRLRKRVA